MKVLSRFSFLIISSLVLASCSDVPSEQSHLLNISVPASEVIDLSQLKIPKVKIFRNSQKKEMYRWLYETDNNGNIVKETKLELFTNINPEQPDVVLNTGLITREYNSNNKLILEKELFIKGDQRNETITNIEYSEKRPELISKKHVINNGVQSYDSLSQYDFANNSEIRTIITKSKTGGNVTETQKIIYRDISMKEKVKVSITADNDYSSEESYEYDENGLKISESVSSKSIKNALPSAYFKNCKIITNNSKHYICESENTSENKKTVTIQTFQRFIYKNKGEPYQFFQRLSSSIKNKDLHGTITGEIIESNTYNNNGRELSYIKEVYKGSAANQNSGTTVEKTSWENTFDATGWQQLSAAKTANNSITIEFIY